MHIDEVSNAGNHNKHLGRVNCGLVLEMEWEIMIGLRSVVRVGDKHFSFVKLSQP